MNPAEVVEFWLRAGAQRWFTKDAAFDAEFRERFLAAHLAAARCELDAWAATPDGALALVLLLDQFPRNAFRDTAHMYATDALARHHAGRAIAAGFDRRVADELQAFFYLPYAHSEQLEDQQRSVELQRRLGPEYLRHAQGHHDIVARFGRFPHRNRLLGREMTDEERSFLESGGFSG